MSKVFIVAPRPGLDMTKAKAFGDLIEIAPNIHPADVDAIRNAAQDIYSEFDTSTDFILASASGSSPLIMAVLGSLMAGWDVRFLVFDSKTQEYRERMLSF